MPSAEAAAREIISRRNMTISKMARLRRLAGTDE
jgi:hypothetical protein